MKKEVVLTGIRSNDEPTLGNYIGAIKPMVMHAKNLAEDYQINFFVPDLHSFTTPIDYSKLFDRTMFNLRLFVASGLPFENSNINIYRQSYIPAHSELAWILTNLTGFGEMSRMVEFKDKSTRLDKQRISVGLFSYPILMAADILLYSSKWVPVGEDQRQHLEFARTIALRFNNQFGDIFTVPEPTVKQQEFNSSDGAPRIRSLKNPSKKMSKSIKDASGTILLSDTSTEIRKKIMSAETDSLASIRYDWVKQPGISNLLTILAQITDKKIVDTVKQWEGKSNYGDLKGEVSDVVCKTIKVIQDRLVDIDTNSIISKLKASEASMQVIANKKLHQVQIAVGLRK